MRAQYLWGSCGVYNTELWLPDTLGQRPDKGCQHFNPLIKNTSDSRLIHWQTLEAVMHTGGPGVTIQGNTTHKPKPLRQNPDMNRHQQIMVSTVLFRFQSVLYSTEVKSVK